MFKSGQSSYLETSATALMQVNVRSLLSPLIFFNPPRAFVGFPISSHSIISSFPKGQKSQSDWQCKLWHWLTEQSLDFRLWEEREQLLGQGKYLAGKGA